MLFIELSIVDFVQKLELVSFSFIIVSLDLKVVIVKVFEKDLRIVLILEMKLLKLVATVLDAYLIIFIAEYMNKLILRSEIKAMTESTTHPTMYRFSGLGSKSVKSVNISEVNRTKPSLISSIILFNLESKGITVIRYINQPIDIIQKVSS
eukprot:403377245